MDKLIEDTIRKYKLIKNESDTVKGSIGLIYPKKRSNDIRISEQELKILFCSELLNKKIIFSVETPTVETYSFTGSTNESGNIDVCVFDFEGKYNRINNIEFKAHNVNYQKDFEKLIGENGNNYLIHVLPSINNGTLYKNKSTLSSRKSVINKYIEEIETIYSADIPKSNKYSKLTFYICVIDPFILLKNIIDKEIENTLEKIENKLRMDYNVFKKELSLNNGNWTKIDLE
jgi:hypothetical protein